MSVIIYHPMTAVTTRNHVHLTTRVRRSVGEAMGRGVARALAAGCRRPCVALPAAPAFPRAPLVALLAAMEALYVVSGAVRAAEL